MRRSYACKLRRSYAQSHRNEKCFPESRLRDRETSALSDFLRKRVRLLAEEGRVCVSYSEL